LAQLLANSVTFTLKVPQSRPSDLKVRRVEAGLIELGARGLA
jgi:hypothetical protein